MLKLCINLVLNERLSLAAHPRTTRSISPLLAGALSTNDSCTIEYIRCIKGDAKVRTFTIANVLNNIKKSKRESKRKVEREEKF